MNAIHPRIAEEAAIRTQLGAIFISLELSRSTWVVTSLSPGGGEKMSKHSVKAGDVVGLFERFTSLTEKARARTGEHSRLSSSRRLVWTDFGYIGCLCLGE